MFEVFKGMKKHLNRLAFFGFGILLLIGAYGSNGEKEVPPGDLGAAHFHLKDLNCSVCHSAPGEINENKCLSCHDKIASRIGKKKGYHKDKNEDCGTCHTEHQGRNSRIIELDENDFDHSETGFELRGMHNKIKNCRSCHSSSRIVKRKHFESYLLLSRDCTGCHSSPHPGTKKNCEQCHDERSWVVDNWRN